MTKHCRPTKREKATKAGQPTYSNGGRKQKVYTERERRNAALARQVQMRLLHPSTADINECINNGRIMNLPITGADLEIASMLRNLRSSMLRNTHKDRNTSRKAGNTDPKTRFQGEKQQQIMAKVWRRPTKT